MGELGEGALRLQKEAEDRQNDESLADKEAVTVEEQKLPAEVSKAASVEVSMITPIDSILKPIKLARSDSGLAIPTSCESLFGSSPDLHHKDPGFSNSGLPQFPLDAAERVGEEFSQSPWGSSVSPEDSVRQQDSSLEENLDN